MNLETRHFIIEIIALVHLTVTDYPMASGILFRDTINLDGINQDNIDIAVARKMLDKLGIILTKKHVFWD